MAVETPLVSVSFINPKKQRGLVAQVPIPSGSVIFSEQPLVCSQYLFNKDYFPSCSHCLKSLEAPNVMLTRLAGIQNDGLVNEMPFLNEFMAIPGNATPEISFCGHCRREMYCSEACRDAAWDQYHCICCVGPSPSSDHPLLQIEKEWKSFHFPPETATPDLLIRMVAMIRRRLDKGVSPEEALQPFAEFKQDYANQELNILHRFFSEETFETRLASLYELYCAALFDERLPSLFTIQGFKSLFCIICLNGQGVGTSSLESYERFLRDHPEIPEDDREVALDYLDEFAEAIEEVSGEFTHAEGTGLFVMHKFINHSCEPNAEISFPFNGAVLQVLATRDIAAGEEISISYIHCCDDDEEEDEEEEDEDCHDACGHSHGHNQGGSSSSAPATKSVREKCMERREMLKEYYLFECMCEKCIREMA